jgi:hypothetical protein
MSGSRSWFTGLAVGVAIALASPAAVENPFAAGMLDQAGRDAGGRRQVAPRKSRLPIGRPQWRRMA